MTMTVELTDAEIEFVADALKFFTRSNRLLVRSRKGR